MAAWTSWFTELGSAVKDQGNPFSGEAKTIAADGSVSDGSGGGSASGYTILKADSLDAATTLAKGCPVLQGGANIMVLRDDRRHVTKASARYREPGRSAGPGSRASEGEVRYSM